MTFTQISQAKPKSEVRLRRKKRLGRPRVKRPFEQTKVGFLIQHEAPTEYQILKDVASSMKWTAPPAQLIESVGYASSAPLFHKEKFRRALMEYRETGLYPAKPKLTNARKELYYIRLRRNTNQFDLINNHNY